MVSQSTELFNSQVSASHLHWKYGTGAASAEAAPVIQLAVPGEFDHLNNSILPDMPFQNRDIEKQVIYLYNRYIKWEINSKRLIIPHEKESGDLIRGPQRI